MSTTVKQSLIVMGILYALILILSLAASFLPPFVAFMLSALLIFVSIYFLITAIKNGIHQADK